MHVFVVLSGPLQPFVNGSGTLRRDIGSPDVACGVAQGPEGGGSGKVPVDSAVIRLYFHTIPNSKAD